MIIPAKLYDHPIVRSVIDDAYARISAWSISDTAECRAAKELLTSGWDGCALMEVVAEPLLELQGIDADDIALWEAIEASEHYNVNTHNRARLYEEWDLARAEWRKGGTDD